MASTLEILRYIQQSVGEKDRKALGITLDEIHRVANLRQHEINTIYVNPVEGGPSKGFYVGNKPLVSFYREGNDLLVHVSSFQEPSSQSVSKRDKYFVVGRKGGVQNSEFRPILFGLKEVPGASPIQLIVIPKDLDSKPYATVLDVGEQQCNYIQINRRR